MKKLYVNRQTMTSEKRIFTVEDSGGRYTGKTPGAAAKKAANNLFKRDPDKKQITFSLRDMTRGGKKGIFSYIARKEVLQSPQIVTIAGKEISIKHKIYIKKGGSQSDSDNENNENDNKSNELESNDQD